MNNFESFGQKLANFDKKLIFTKYNLFKITFSIKI